MRLRWWCKGTRMNPYLSINLPFDAIGQDDPRPGCWGKAGYCDVLVPFTAVPAGRRVRILAFNGDCYAYINGDPQPGKHVGIMAGMITSTSGPMEGEGIIDGIKYIGGFNDASPFSKAKASPDVDPRTVAMSDCCLYVCDSVATDKSTCRIRIERDWSRIAAILDDKNCLLMRQALFLNDTGCSVHMEMTGVLEYEYVD